MATTVAFSAAGTVASGYPKDDNLQTAMQAVLSITLANSEVATITHGRDSENVRSVLVLDSNGDNAELGATPKIAVRRLTTTTTRLTAGAAGAGTYKVVLKY